MSMLLEISIIQVRAEKLIFPCFSSIIWWVVLPIDPDFQKKRKIVSQHNGHNVWGPVEPPTKLGIHGTNVAVDWEVCTGDGVCIEVCPVSLFDWADSPGHPTSEKKSDPAREKECIQCLACETQCPTQAIKITPP
jgi:NAD-dependent dihydropyrimidine dehydrogenase PreA subunit